MATRHLRITVAASLMIAAAACSATHTQGGAPAEGEQAALHDDPYPLGFLCEEGQRRTVDGGEVSQVLGFAPDEVLAFALGHHEAPLRWNDDSDVRLSAETSARTLEIDIEQAGDVVSFDPEHEYTGHGATCEHWFEVPVRVTLHSGDGALDETFLATLRTRRADFAFIEVTAEAGVLDGTLSARLLAEGMELAPRELFLTLSIFRSSVSGVLDASSWHLPGEDDVYPYEGRALAHFGPADCPRSQLAIDLSEPTYGAMGRSIVDRLTDLVELDVTWSDGSITRARATFTSDATATCVTPSFYPTATQAIAEIEGVLQLQTQDGRLDGSYAVTPSMNGDVTEPPAQHPIRVGEDVYLSDVPATPAELGFVGISASEVERPSLSLSFTLLGNGMLDEEASITLWAHEPPCEPDASSCVADFEAAERGTLSL